MARILVVDDDEQVRRFYQLILEGEGHQITLVSNGFEAIIALEKNTFDLVLTDYDMPKMKGDELALEIKDKNPALPIVMVTGSEFPESADVNYFVAKPVSPPVLLAITKSLFGK